jgi:hypothetical protein
MQHIASMLAVQPTWGVKMPDAVQLQGSQAVAGTKQWQAAAEGLKLGEKAVRTVQQPVNGVLLPRLCR